MGYFKKMALVCVMAVSCIMVCRTEASAANLLQEELSLYDGSSLIEDDYAEDKETLMTRGNFLSYGVTKIEDKGGRKVVVAGTTACHVYCDKVICNLYLEQLNEEGHWYTYKFWKLYTTNEASYSPSKVVSVEGGHWYRVRGGHSAEENGGRESVTTKTDGIYIS